MFREFLSRMGVRSVFQRVCIVAAVAGASGFPTVLAAAPAPEDEGQTRNLYYTVSYDPVAGSSELFAIKVIGNKVTSRDIGPMGAGGCGSLAMSPSGMLFSMCGPLFGSQQLSMVNTKTGQATPFGVPVAGLAVMSMTFGPNGVLYAIG